MRWLGQWRRAPVTMVLVAWVVSTAALLTLYFVAQARIVERDWNEMGFRLGATAADIHVNWLAMWPQLASIYLGVVVLPPTALWFLWRRARRSSAPRQDDSATGENTA